MTKRRLGAAIATVAAAGATLGHLGRTYGSTGAERAEALPGDELVGRPDVQTDHAVTIGAPPAAVWPWLVQMGWGAAAGTPPDGSTRSSSRPTGPARTSSDPTCRTWPWGASSPTGHPGPVADSRSCSSSRHESWCSARTATSRPPGGDGPGSTGPGPSCCDRSGTEAAPGSTSGRDGRRVPGGSPPSAGWPSCRRTSSWRAAC